jgi:hypothetical protein
MTGMRFLSFFRILEVPDSNLDPEIIRPDAGSAFLNIQTAI